MQGKRYFLLCLRKNKLYEELSLLFKYYASPYPFPSCILVLSPLLAGNATAREARIEHSYFLLLRNIPCAPIRETSSSSLKEDRKRDGVDYIFVPFISSKALRILRIFLL